MGRSWGVFYDAGIVEDWHNWRRIGVSLDNLFFMLDIEHWMIS